MTFDNNGDGDGGGGLGGARSGHRATGLRRAKTVSQDRKPREYKPRTPRPIDAAQLQDLAIGYAARYATTAARLRRYLDRKLGERVWTPSEPADIESLVTRITTLGYVDDRAWATAKARALGHRGFGARRVRGALSAAGVSRDDAAAALGDDGAPESPPESPFASAVAFARRRRFGPFARDAAGAGDPARARRELAAMARAGHDFEIARRVLAARSEAAAEALADNSDID